MKTVDLSKAAFLRVRGIDRHPHRNQSFPIHFRGNFIEFVSHIFLGAIAPARHSMVVRTLNINTWLSILIPSAFDGTICAWKLNGKIALICSGAIPWIGLLSWLLFNEYFMPYRGGDASMWPIGLLFAGTTAAATGLFACYTLQKYYMRLA